MPKTTRMRDSRIHNTPIYRGDPGEWVIGTRVRHKDDGEGTIVGYSDFENSPLEHWIVVDFDNSEIPVDETGAQRVFGEPDQHCPAFRDMVILKPIYVCAGCDGVSSADDYLCKECRNDS
jgi:hypothetical protein